MTAAPTSAATWTSGVKPTTGTRAPTAECGRSGTGPTARSKTAPTSPRSNRHHLPTTKTENRNDRTTDRLRPRLPRHQPVQQAGHALRAVRLRTGFVEQQRGGEPGRLLQP